MLKDLLINSLIIISACAALVFVFFIAKRKYLSYRRLKRSMNMVFLKVLISKRESQEEQDKEKNTGTKDFKEAIGIMGQLFDSLHSIYSGKLKNGIRGYQILLPSIATW